MVLQAYNIYNKDYDEIMEKINSGDLCEKTLQEILVKFSAFADKI